MLSAVTIGDVNMSESKSCFLCSTTFQLITAMQICYGRREKADLYILPLCPNGSVYRDRISEVKLFHKVSVIDGDSLSCLYKKQSALRYNINSFLCYLNIKKIVSKMISVDASYDKFYFSSVTPYSKLIQLYFYRYSKKTEIILFDDGEGSYDDPYIIGKLSKADYVARKILFHYRMNTKLILRYLYSPSLYTEINGHGYRVKKIQNKLSNDEFVNMINHIFEFNEIDKISEKYIILDVIKEIRFTQTGKEKLLSIYRKISDIVGKENLIIKQHPRDKDTLSESFQVYNNQSIPLEIIELNSNIQNKVIITVASTAIFTTKVLLNQEPIVILLNKLFLEDDLLYNTEGRKDGKVQRFNLECFNLYNDKNRFMFPDSIEILEHMLRSIQ